MRGGEISISMSGSVDIFIWPVIYSAIWIIPVRLDGSMSSDEQMVVSNGLLDAH